MKKGMNFSLSCAKSKYKTDCNKEYRNLINRFDCKQGKHLILDSRFKNTTKALNLAKIPSKNIYVPNPYEKVNTPNWSNESVGEFLENNIHMTFSSVYLDYCCSLKGNKDTTPLNDIKYLIENDMVDGILGVEFSGRSKKLRKWQDIFETIHEIEELAIENDYIYQVINGWVYKNMFVCWFYLKK